MPLAFVGGPRANVNQALPEIAMRDESIVIQGAVLPDGSLQLPGPIHLPAGPVEIVVRPVGPAEKREGLLEVLARIDAARESWPDYVPRTAEQIDASVRQMRDEGEERQLAIERLQEECRRARDRQTFEGGQ